MKFEVRALHQGVVEILQVDAVDVAEASAKVAAQQRDVLSIRRLREFWHRPPRFELSLFAQELAELIEAGLSVTEAVETLANQQTDKEASKTYCQLEGSLRQGLTLAAAMSQLPDKFPPLFVGIIRAAERTSDLAGALARYIEYSGRIEALKTKITSALIYPAILSAVGGAVVVFLLTYVVPRFANVYQGTGRELPLLSTLLLRWGGFASQHALVLTIGAAVLSAAAILAVAQAKRRGRLAQWVELLPGARHRIQLFRLSRLYLTVGTLLNGGMPLVQALSLAQGVITGAYRGRLDAAIEALRRGGAIAESLEQHQLTTPVAVRLIRAGEGSGQMGDLFIRAGRYHDNELGRWVERFSRSFEPLLMAAIGVLIGGIVILLRISANVTAHFGHRDRRSAGAF